MVTGGGLSPALVAVPIQAPKATVARDIEIQDMTHLHRGKAGISVNRMNQTQAIRTGLTKTNMPQNAIHAILGAVSIQSFDPRRGILILSLATGTAILAFDYLHRAIPGINLNLMGLGQTYRCRRNECWSFLVLYGFCNL
jgi:hypothetical protein